MGKKTSITTARKEQYKEDAAHFFPKGSTVYTLVTRVSRSGMSRRIRTFAVENGRIYETSFIVASIMGWRINDDGMFITGGNMDMCFHVVESLSREIHGDGYALSYGRL